MRTATPTLGSSTALLAVAAIGSIDAGAAGFPARIPEPLRRYVVINDDYKAQTRALTCSLPELIPAGAYAPSCYRPRRAGERSIFVWGDSFAARLYTGLAATYAPAVNVRQMTRDQCVPWLGRDRLCVIPTRPCLKKSQYLPEGVVAAKRVRFYELRQREGTGVTIKSLQLRWA